MIPPRGEYDSMSVTTNLSRLLKLGESISNATKCWAPIPLRLIVGYGFMEHGFAKLARGLDTFPAILQALGMPAPHLMGWLTILVEIFGRLALKPISFTSHPLRPSSWRARDHWRSTAFWQSAENTCVLPRAPSSPPAAGEPQELIKPLPSVDAGHTGAPDMSAGFGSWLFGASALGGMLGMASSIFIVLAATTFGSALLYAISGFGFAVLAAAPFLLFLDPARAIELVIIISTVLSIVVLRGLLPAIAPWLLLRLALGGLVGLPLGLVTFRYADPILVRAAAGAMIFGSVKPIFTTGSIN